MQVLYLVWSLGWIPHREPLLDSNIQWGRVVSLNQDDAMTTLFFEHPYPTKSDMRLRYLEAISDRVLQLFFLAIPSELSNKHSVPQSCDIGFLAVFLLRHGELSS